MNFESLNKKFIYDRNIVVAVDIAVNKSGLAILGDDFTILHTEVLELKAHWDYYRKLSLILSYFSELFSNLVECQPKSIALVLEGRLRRGFSGATLASIEGARVSAYHAFHLSVQSHPDYEDSKQHVYPPDVVKRRFTGKPNASKSTMYSHATSQFSSLRKIKFQEDIYDAIYLGIYHLMENGLSPKKRSK